MKGCLKFIKFTNGTSNKDFCFDLRLENVAYYFDSMFTFYFWVNIRSIRELESGLKIRIIKF